MLGPPMMAVVTVLGPVIVGLNAVANGTLRLLRVEPRDEVSSTFTREEVAALVEESRGEGLLEDERVRPPLGCPRVHRAHGRERAAPDEVARAPCRQGATAADVEDLCAATGFSRFPVVDDDGRARRLPAHQGRAGARPRPSAAPIEDKWVHPFASVRARDALHEALETLQRRGAHMARVVGEDGATLGLATLEDVLEELVGEIRDAAHLDDTAPAG